MKLKVYGIFSEMSGWGRHSSGFAGELSKHFPVQRVDWSFSTPSVEQCEADIGIAIGPIERIPEMVEEYRIAFFAWETTQIPRAKIAALHSADEVWIPSGWGRDILIDNGLPRGRVRVIPEGVDADFFQTSQRLRSGDQPFRFLCIGKWENRKGIEDLVRAYVSEFAHDESVELILHCHNPYKPGFTIEEALKDIASPPYAAILPSYPLSDSGLVALYQSCDAFVLPSKAEGWGLPLLEAMACGIPTIATYYSAPVEFIHDGNGFPLRNWSMTRVHDPFFYGEHEDLGYWAKPESADIQAALRAAFSDPDGCKRRGIQARLDVEAGWTWKHSAFAARQRLDEIAQNMK